MYLGANISLRDQFLALGIEIIDVVPTLNLRAIRCVFAEYQKILKLFCRSTYNKVPPARFTTLSGGLFGVSLAFSTYFVFARLVFFNVSRPPETHTTPPY